MTIDNDAYWDSILYDYHHDLTNGFIGNNWQLEVSSQPIAKAILNGGSVNFASIGNMTYQLHRNGEQQMIGFKEWPKIARLNRPVVITEKIDGTNSCVIVTSTRGYQFPGSGATVESETDGCGRYWSGIGDKLPGVIVDTFNGPMVVGGSRLYEARRNCYLPRSSSYFI